MKKIKVILCCIVICINLGGCIRPMSRGERLTKELGSEQQMSDQIMEEIISALDKRDAGALKEQFSEEALGEATDLDQQIADLMNFYQGTMTEFSGDASSSTSTEYGRDIEKFFIGYYTLTTDETIYQVTFSYKPIDKNNPDKIGLSKLELVSQETYDKQVDESGTYTWKCGKQGAGVYYTK